MGTGPLRAFSSEISASGAHNKTKPSGQNPLIRVTITQFPRLSFDLLNVLPFPRAENSRCRILRRKKLSAVRAIVSVSRHFFRERCSHFAISTFKTRVRFSQLNVARNLWFSCGCKRQRRSPKAENCLGMIQAAGISGWHQCNDLSAVIDERAGQRAATRGL